MEDGNISSWEPSAPPLSDAGARVDWLEWADRLRRLRMMQYENKTNDRSVKNSDVGRQNRCARADGIACNGDCLQMEVRVEEDRHGESRWTKDKEMDENVKKQAQEDAVTWQDYAGGRHELQRMQYSSSQSSSVRSSSRRGMLVRQNAYRGRDWEWDQAAWPDGGSGVIDDDDDESNSSCSEEHASSKDMWVVEPERAAWGMQGDGVHKVCSKVKRAHSVHGTYANAEVAGTYLDKDSFLHGQRGGVRRQACSESFEDIIIECGSLSTWAGASCEPRGSLEEANSKRAYSASTADVAVMRARAAWNAARTARRKCKQRVKSKLVHQVLVLTDMTVPRAQ